ncbi:MAG: ferredoxin [Acidimicrobiales bacterium]
MLHVQIDARICQGTGYCARIAPDVFEVQGRVGVVLEPHPDPEHEAVMEEAATLCPTRAISY